MIGSELIGQAFAGDRYFHSRPSATVGPDPADPTKTVAGALQRREFRRLEPRADQQGPDRARPGRCRGAQKAQAPAGAAVPMDLVTTSGSGLDPHITPEAALFQVPRVAQARGLPRGARAPARRGARSRAARSAFLVSRGSTCWRSISPSTGCGESRRRRIVPSRLRAGE